MPPGGPPGGRYLAGDVWHFVARSPYLALAKPASAVSYLRPWVEAAGRLDRAAQREYGAPRK